MAAQFDYIPSTTDFQSTAEPLIIQVRETTAGPFFKYRFILVIKNRNGDQLAKLKTHPWPRTTSPPSSISLASVTTTSAPT